MLVGLRLQDCRLLQPSARFIANEADAVIGVAVEGLGLIQAPVHFVRRQIHENALVPVLTDFHASIHTLYLCYPSRDNRPLRVRAFIDFVMSEARRGRFSHDCKLPEQATVF